jgi:hypothetical protein
MTMTTTSIATRTTKQVLDAQKAIAKPVTTAIAVVPSRTGVEKYLDEYAPSTFSGKLLKFSKEGKFIIVDTGAEIGEETDFLALCDETLVGWIKFNGPGNPPDRIQGLLYEGFEMPSRDTLGDEDRSQWENGLDGTPADPWQHQQCLVLQETGTGEIFTFTTSSETGRRAVGNLLRHYERLRRSDPSLCPIVRLKKGGYAHKEKRIGWVNTPLFVVVGKASKDTAVKPDTSSASDMNDEIPF